MSYFSKLEDKRINAVNFSFEISIKEYLEIASAIMENNQFQRRRVKSSSTIYELLKDDLKIGCVIPPLVLALSQEGSHESINGLRVAADVIRYLETNTNDLSILDGLQRTFTMAELQNDLQKSLDKASLELFSERKIRLELYVGVNRLGILYRMLTLNTGQTPMSLRHQIEILYYDYLNHTVDGLQLVAEVDESRVAGLTDYNFRDVIGGFNSYLERNELPIDKLDLLENIKGLEKLSKENQNHDIFKSYLKSFHSFLLKMIEIGQGWSLPIEEVDSFGGNAFGTNMEAIFKKAQVLAAYGAAIGRMKDFKVIEDFDSLTSTINQIRFNETPQVGLLKLLRVLNEIRLKSKKIGNAQRMYFVYFFRELLNPQSDSYGIFESAVENAYQKYLSQI